MSQTTTLQQAIDQILADKATALEVLIPDMLDAGSSYDDIAFEIRRLTNVGISSRTVRRWATTFGKDAA